MSMQRLRRATLATTILVSVVLIPASGSYGENKKSKIKNVVIVSSRLSKDGRIVRSKVEKYPFVKYGRQEIFRKQSLRCEIVFNNIESTKISMKCSMPPSRTDSRVDCIKYKSKEMDQMYFMFVSTVKSGKILHKNFYIYCEMN